MKKKTKQRKGFTLVELLAVIVVLGIVAAIAVPATTSYIQNSKESLFFTNVRIIVDSLKNNEPVEDTKQTYLYDNETIQKPSNVEVVNVVSYYDKDEDQRKYLVNAKYAEDQNIAITTLDFYSLSADDKENWVFTDAIDSPEGRIEAMTYLSTFVDELGIEETGGDNSES